MATQKQELAPAEAAGSTIGGRGVKLLGEAVVAPGSSLFLDGEIGNGALHVVGGLAATWLIGPLGWILVAANSYSQSVAGGHLFKQFKRDGKPPA